MTVERNGQIQHLLEMVYHGNPLSSEVSLVTFDYRMSSTELISRISGMNTQFIFKKILGWDWMRNSLMFLFQKRPNNPDDNAISSLILILNILKRMMNFFM